MQALLLTLKPKEYNALFHTVSAECAAITLGVAPSLERHDSPWPVARCPPGPPVPLGSPSQLLVLQRDWLGTPPARPSSGCPTALGSFPFSDPPGAPSEPPSQTCQSTGKRKKDRVSEWLGRWLDVSLIKQKFERWCELIQPAV